MFLNPSRRHFLRTTAAALASFFLPRSLFASDPDRSFWFIHADSCTSWPVADPVKWSLDHAHEPVLGRATEGLAKLTADDGDRIIRLGRPALPPQPSRTSSRTGRGPSLVIASC